MFVMISNESKNSGSAHCREFSWNIAYRGLPSYFSTSECDVWFPLLWVIFRAGQISDGTVGTGQLDDKVGEVLRGLVEGWGVNTCYVCVRVCVCEERKRETECERAKESVCVSVSGDKECERECGMLGGVCVCLLMCWIESTSDRHLLLSNVGYIKYTDRILSPWRCTHQGCRD